MPKTVVLSEHEHTWAVEASRGQPPQSLLLLEEVLPDDVEKGGLQVVEAKRLFLSCCCYSSLPFSVVHAARVEVRAV